jgi:hypothetical protein
MAAVLLTRHILQDQVAMVGAEEDLMELDNVWVPQAAVRKQLPLKLQVCCQIARELLDCNQLLCDSVLGQDHVAERTFAKVVQVPTVEQSGSATRQLANQQLVQIECRAGRRGRLQLLSACV